jgi:tryptophan-rich sensory protein
LKFKKWLFIKFFIQLIFDETFIIIFFHYNVSKASSIDCSNN